MWTRRGNHRLPTFVFDTWLLRGATLPPLTEARFQLARCSNLVPGPCVLDDGVHKEQNNPIANTKRPAYPLRIILIIFSLDSVSPRRKK